MFFVITSLIESGSLELYATATPDHEKYLDNCRGRLLAAGSIVGSDGMPTGNLCILEADTLLSAAQFVESDPMTTSGAMASIEIAEWRMSHLNSGKH